MKNKNGYPSECIDIGGVKPETAIEILERNNLHISLPQAQLILSFMHKLAKTALNQIENESGFIYSSKYR
jgi:hypothetical protein